MDTLPFNKDSTDNDKCTQQQEIQAGFQTQREERKDRNLQSSLKESANGKKMAYSFFPCGINSSRFHMNSDNISAVLNNSKSHPHQFADSSLANSKQEEEKEDILGKEVG